MAEPSKAALRHYGEHADGVCTLNHLCVSYLILPHDVQVAVQADESCSGASVS